MKIHFLLFAVLGIAGCAHYAEPPPQAREAPPSPAREYTIVDVDPTSTVELDVPYVPTPQGVVERMLEVAEVGENDIVYDLGSGDGRIVITAVLERGARRGVGIEIDPARIREANENAAAAGVADRVSFRLGDIFEEDFREATVVMMYLLPAINLRLRPRLLNELQPGTRIVSHAFDMGEWTPDEEWTVRVVNGRAFELNFWRIPANLTGAWQAVVEGPELTAFLMEIDQEFQVISGVIGGRPITEGRVDGRHFSFQVAPAEPGASPWTFSGESEENTLTGVWQRGAVEYAWTATRQPGTRRLLEEPENSQ